MAGPVATLQEEVRITTEGYDISITGVNDSTSTHLVYIVTDESTAGVTSVAGGTGLSSTGGTTPSISVDYAGTDNIIDAATNLEGTAIDAGDTIMYHDATDNNIKKGLISDLPSSGGGGGAVDYTEFQASNLYYLGTFSTWRANATITAG
jgi:hypothetical protein